MVAVLDIIVLIFGVAMGLSPLLQLQRMVRTRRSDDVALSMLGVLLVGSLLWLLYGIAHGQIPIIIANTAGLTAYISTLAVAVRLRRPAPVLTMAGVAADTAPSPAGKVVALSRAK